MSRLVTQLPLRVPSTLRRGHSVSLRQYLPKTALGMLCGLLLPGCTTMRSAEEYLKHEKGIAGLGLPRPAPWWHLHGVMSLTGHKPRARKPVALIVATSKEGPLTALDWENIIAVRSTVAEFRLVDTCVSEDDLRNLGRLEALERLEIVSAVLPVGGMKHLAAPAKLATVCLENTSVSDDDVSHLAMIPHLTVLSITGAPITADSLQFLVGHPALRRLVLESCPSLGTEAAIHVADMLQANPDFWFEVADCPLTESAVLKELERRKKTSAQ